VNTDEEINKFDGKYGFLSNFYPARITYDIGVVGITEPVTGLTLEHVYQACKARTREGALRVLAAETAGKAKAKGRDIALRVDWTEEKRIQVMTDLLRLKFEIPGLRKQLLDTRSAWLVEGNTWNDTFWGVCRGKGKNMLGLLLMQVRHEIRNGK
jgi:ribA/ribD-fused uncharacterized protein